MAYINHFKLFQALVAEQPLDVNELLTDIKRDKIVAALERSKDGLPKAIRVTNAPMEEANFAKLPERVKRRLQQLGSQIFSEPLAALPKLQKLQAKYPHIPSIANYISIVYHKIGQEEQALDSLWDMRKRYPDYLFGKIGLAEYYLRHDEHQRIPEIFENKFELWQHLPNRDLFHISEARALWSIVGTYNVRRNNMARALYHYMLLSDIEPDHLATSNLGNEIILKEIGNLRKNRERRR